ncbi:MAG TPA: hypothetical protein VJ901_15045 [Thermoanaerobaculia bacterium]|nr:hypothetical protein [Thermoanaerobaculia bacterium]
MRVFPTRIFVLFFLIACSASAATRLRTIIPNAPQTIHPAASPNPVTLSFVGDQKQVTVFTNADPGFADPSITYSFANFPAFIQNDGPKTTTLASNYAPIVFTFTLGAGASPGTYNGSLIAASSGFPTPQVFPFTVIVPPPDLNASWAKPSIQLCNGGSTTDDILSLVPVNGYSGTPQITFTSVPPGITINPPGPLSVNVPPPQNIPFAIGANGAAAGSQIVIANVSDPVANINKNVSLLINVVNPDFTQGVTPSTLTLTAGGAAQSIAPTVTPNPCFNKTVSVTASGEPPGMTITPPSITVGSPYNPGSMSIQAAASVPPGTYPITLTYSTPGQTKTAVVQVTVKASADFVIHVNPNTAAASPGGGTSVVVTITPVNGFNGTVTIASPSTPDITFSPATFDLIAGGSQTVTIDVAPNAQPGPRTLQFSGISPNVPGTHTAPFTLIVQDFELTATPPQQIVLAGTNAIVTVGATSPSGFTGPVTVTAPTIPGLTFTPQTFTVNANGAGQQVTIGVGQLPTGAINVTFTGSTAGGTPKTATVLLLIAATPDFRITVTPDALSLPDGGSATVAVGVTSINGFGAPVSITAPVIPGVTFNPSTFVVNPGSSQNVALTILPGTAPGLRTGTFTGRSGGTTREATLTLTITQRPDFTLTATPPSLAIFAGDAGAEITISAAGINGFNAPITVTAPVGPGTYTPSTFTLLPGQSQKVIVRSLVAQSPKLAIFTGTSGDLTHQASVLITVRPQRPILTAVAPSAVVAGANGVVVHLAGQAIQPGAVFHIDGTDVTVGESVVHTSQLADLTLFVHSGATPGPRNITVTNPDGGTSEIPVVLLVYPTSSIAAPLDVTAAAIVYPPKGTLIAPTESLYPRGLLATTGTGTIIGSWLFDGAPFDRFVVNAAGGMPVEVRANVPVPVSFAGTHTIGMVIETPRHAVSPVIEVIDAIDRVSRLTLLAPRDGAVVPRDQLFRWSLVPNCTGFDVEIEHTPPMTFRVNDAQWRPTKDDLASIGPGIHRWRVRPRCAADVDLEATEWRRFAILPEHADITLLPITNRTIRWNSAVAGLLYRVEFLDANGNTIFAALTSRTEYVAPGTIPSGTSVRVSALAPNGAILGTSSSSPLARAGVGQALSLSRQAESLPYIHLAQDVVTVEFGAVDPADGSTIQNPQPRITAQWKGAVKPDQVILLVDNTDLTALATVTPTSVTYDSLIALAPGPHSVALSVAGNINRWTFNVGEAAAAEAPVPAETSRGDWVIAPVGTITLVRDATNEAHAQLSALTDLNSKSLTVTNKATGDLALKHDFDTDSTTQESRNWLTDAGAHQGTAASEAVRIGFAGPDFFDQAQLLTAGLPRGGIQAKVVVPGGTASYYQTFTSRSAGVVSGLFGPEQKIKAAAFQIPFNQRWDFRVLALRTDDAPGFTSAGGEGNALGIFARFTIGATLNAIFEGAHGDFKPNFNDFEERQKGNAYRLGLNGMRGTVSWAFNLRRTEASFINPANRGFTPGGVPDRTGADLTLAKYFGTSAVTVQLRHLQDGTTSGLLVPRTRETGGLVSYTTMFGQHVSLALTGNLTQDKGDEKPEVFLPKSDREQSGGTATLAEFFGRLSFSQTLTRQLMRDRVFNLNDQTITSATVTGNGFFNTYFNLGGVLSSTRSEGSFIVGTTDQTLASVQPAFNIPKLWISLQPRVSYSTSKNDLYPSKTTTEQYQGLVTFAPQWAGSIIALQLSADWTKNTFDGQLGPAKFVHRYVGTINLHWRAGMGPAYVNYVPFAVPGAPATPANPATATPGAPALPPH